MYNFKENQAMTKGKYSPSHFYDQSGSKLCIFLNEKKESHLRPPEKRKTKIWLILF